MRLYPHNARGRGPQCRRSLPPMAAPAPYPYPHIRPLSPAYALLLPAASFFPGAAPHIPHRSPVNGCLGACPHRCRCPLPTWGVHILSSYPLWGLAPIVAAAPCPHGECISYHYIRFGGLPPSSPPPPAPIGASIHSLYPLLGVLPPSSPPPPAPSFLCIPLGIGRKP